MLIASIKNIPYNFEAYINVIHLALCHCTALRFVENRSHRKRINECNLLRIPGTD